MCKKSVGARLQTWTQLACHPMKAAAQKSMAEEPALGVLELQHLMRVMRGDAVGWQWGVKWQVQLQEELVDLLQCLYAAALLAVLHQTRLPSLTQEALRPALALRVQILAVKQQQQQQLLRRNVHELTRMKLASLDVLMVWMKVHW
jgi:hypothetical protein